MLTMDCRKPPPSKQPALPETGPGPGNSLQAQFDAIDESFDFDCFDSAPSRPGAAAVTNSAALTVTTEPCPQLPLSLLHQFPSFTSEEELPVMALPGSAHPLPPPADSAAAAESSDQQLAGAMNNLSMDDAEHGEALELIEAVSPGE